MNTIVYNNLVINHNYIKINLKNYGKNYSYNIFISVLFIIFNYY